MKTVNLNEIFEAKAFYNNCLYDLSDNEKQCVIDLMREACEQTVETTDEDLKEVIKRQFPYNKFDDKYDLLAKQFDYWDMISFVNNILSIAKNQIV